MRIVFAEYRQALVAAIEALSEEDIERAGTMLYEAWARGSQVLLAGNGGSAATANHFCCDLARGASVEGCPRVRAISLAANCPFITASANDSAYEMIFVEQMRSLLRPEDLVILISASGNSPNVVRASEFSAQNGCQVLALVGFFGGKLKRLANHSIWVQSDDYGVVEDVHLALTHMLSQQLRERIERSWMKGLSVLPAPI